ncbi:MAG: pentapeptide repeat-containing protein [Terriglobia bacterium]
MNATVSTPDQTPHTFPAQKLINCAQGGYLIAGYWEYGYAGGGGQPFVGPDNSGQGVNGSSQDLGDTFQIVWLSANFVALFDPMHQCYAGITSQNGLNLLTFNDTNGNYYTSIGPQAMFKMLDEHGGKVAFTALVGVNYVTAGYWDSDINAYVNYLDPENPNAVYCGLVLVQNPGVGPDAQFQLQGSHLPILVICRSAVSCNLEKCDLSAGGLINSLAGYNLTGANLTGADFSKLEDKSLAKTNFTLAQLPGAVLSDVDVTQATWSQAVLPGTDLTTINPNAQRTVFDQVDLSNCILGSPQRVIHFEGSHFTPKCKLVGAKLVRSDFTHCDFTGAQLNGADLTDADLTGAILDGADLTGATLTRTILQHAQMNGTKFINCDLTETVFDRPAKFGRDATNRVSLAGATVPFEVLGLDWSTLDLTGATILNIPTKIDNLNAANALLPTELDLSNCSIKNSYFTNVQALNAHFNKSDLNGAQCESACFNGSEFSGANLQGANLYGAFLLSSGVTQTDPVKPTTADLNGAFLINATLDTAQCNGADFENALFLTYTGVSGAASAQKAQMNGAKFNGAVLVGATLDGAFLNGANLAGAVLVSASFIGAQLGPEQGNSQTNASMNGADIRGTKFAHEDGSSAALMDGLDMTKATYSTENGNYTPSSPLLDYYGNQIYIATSYGPTKLGNTTSNTICPNGEAGPCAL